jgi:predicted alpha-1,2-mannosidase
MRKLFIILQTVFVILAGLITSAAPVWGQNTAFDYVNPFIGTNEMGHTYPGATVPFGMVQLSPDTGYVPFFKDGKYNKKVYRYCAGYQYKDKTIIGFSHTHFNGTGHSDLGDFLVMPTVGKLLLEPGSADQPDSGFRSRFSHQNEAAQPGYYRVRLEDYGIDAELTASTRVGFHKYTFPKSDNAHIILDLIYSIYGYDGKVIWSSVRVENDRLITGFRQTRGWARAHYLYFAMEFSKPFKSYGCINKEEEKYKGFWDRAMKRGENFPQMEGRAIRAYFNFSTKERETIKIKFAISGVSTEGALKNLRAEVPHWDFEKTRAEARALWEKELNRVSIAAPAKDKEVFYTAMYHTLLGPVIYMDVDGRYRGLDQNIHQAEGFTNYTLFSLWDTYRALHPWLTILHPQRVNQMVSSMLAHWDQSVHKLLPVWSFHANEDWCMTGYHSVPVIVDAYMKGIRGYDVDKAFKAVLASARHEPYSGLGNYMKYGYIPLDLEFGANSASKTLEYAYDDWTIAQFANALGKEKEAKEFTHRAGFYRNLFDKKTKFIRARKADGGWLEPFDPVNTHGQGYIEGNAWNYSLHIPQDIRGYIKLVGGNRAFIKMLDTLFTMHTPDEAIAHTEDIEKNGIIGGYIHGNEPGHHIPYLYNYAGAPWKTQAIVHRIIDNMYSNETDGIPGNDDTGQMSAWYLFSALGFYPVCPGSNEYVIGSPCVQAAVLHLENNKTFTMTAKNLSKKNIYIQSIRLNGKPLKVSYIRHEDIMKGGTLKFQMGPTPNKRWAARTEHAPYSMTGKR